MREVRKTAVGTKTHEEAETPEIPEGVPDNRMKEVKEPECQRCGPVTLTPNILTAKACAAVRADARAKGKVKLRITKKTAMMDWLLAARSSGKSGQRVGNGIISTMNFEDRKHPWTRIHETHEVWHCDLIAFCRNCGIVSKRKGQCT